MRLLAFAATVTGPRHLELSEPNQDAITLQGFRGGWIGAIADGLGSRKHSDVGSRCACHAAAEVLRRASTTRQMEELLGEVQNQWLRRIHPLNHRDAATTLLFFRVSRNGQFQVAQLGDGLLLVRSNGRFHRLTPERKGYGNQTEALGAILSLDEWVWAQGCLSQSSDAIVLMSDGVSDDLDHTQLSDFVSALRLDLQHRNRRTGRRWLQRELHDWATPLHSDDKSLIAIFRD